MITNESIDMKHCEPGFRFENDWPSENLAHISQNYKAGETIPVDVNIEIEQHVLIPTVLALYDREFLPGTVILALPYAPY